jgi:hypothetical protein
MESIWMEQALHLYPQTPFLSRFFFSIGVASFGEKNKKKMFLPK